MEEIVSLIIPFIALAFLSVMIDKLTLFIEGIMHKLPHFPDQFEWHTAYAVVLIISTVVCWQGDFRFFDYLNLFFPTHLDYFMTALVISGGSVFVRSQFSMIDAIPSAVMGVTGTFTRMFPKGGKQEETISNKVVEKSTSTNEYQSYSNIEEQKTTDEYPVAKDYDDKSRYSDDI